MGTSSTECIPGVGSFELILQGGDELLVYQFGAPDKTLVIRNLATGSQQPGYAQRVVDWIITREEIDVFAFPEPNKPSGSEPDWAAITDRITKKYGAEYAECNVLRTKTVWYSEKHDWPAKTKSGLALLEKCGLERSWMGANRIAWDTFLHSQDKAELETAAKWTRQKTQKHPEDVQQLDTYANLLYKLGSAAEALESEGKAIKTARETNFGGLKDMEEAFEKMKKGEPTWSSN